MGTLAAGGALVSTAHGTHGLGQEDSWVLGAGVVVTSDVAPHTLQQALKLPGGGVVSAGTEGAKVSCVGPRYGVAVLWNSFDGYCDFIQCFEVFVDNDCFKILIFSKILIRNIGKNLQTDAFNEGVSWFFNRKC